MQLHWKNILPIMALTILSLSIAAAPAQAFLDAGKNQIGIIDIKMIMAKSKAGSALTQKIKADLDSLKAENDKKEAGLKKERAAINKLPAAEQKAAEIKLRQKFETMKIAADNKRNAIDQKSGDAIKKLRETALNIVKKVKEKHGMTLILERNAVVMGGGELNITKEVIAELDKVMPSVPF